MTLFITATGTGIGKTFVAAGLLRALRRAGRPATALKPVLSGYDPAAPADSDPAHLLAAMGQPVTAPNIARVSPLRFAAPLSPDIAAAREGRVIDFDALINLCRHENPHLIEGIGGVMVPLTHSHTVLDWMAALNHPVLLVAGSYLGTLSHTLTALAALQSRQLAIATIIINETPNNPPIDETIATLRRFAPEPPIHPLPYGAAPDNDLFSRLIVDLKD
jgi:dethiobiotin synthetase